MEGALKCPRCGSTNTKFCYFNNYSKSQPRHLCKACQRYWTVGGKLRDIPPGGGTYKVNKADQISTSLASATASVSMAGEGLMDTGGDINELWSIPFDPPFLPGTLNIPYFDQASMVLDSSAGRWRRQMDRNNGSAAAGLGVDNSSEGEDEDEDEDGWNVDDFLVDGEGEEPQPPTI